MKILVTGATGFLGMQLVPRLAADGHHVRAIARTPSSGFPSGVELIQADLTQPDSVRRAVQGIQAIYHLAGLVSFNPKDGRKMYELHVDATQQLLKAAKEADTKRIILASSSGTIAVSKDERIGTEADDYPIGVVGRWPYYLSKIYQEKLALQFCRSHSIPLVVLNPGLFLGPGDERLSSTWIVSKFLNQDIPAMPSGGLAFVDVRDAADAFVQALRRGELYSRHLMGVNMSFKEFFGRLERMTGVAAPKLRLPPRLNVLGTRLLERWAELRGTEASIDHHSVEIGEHFFYLDSSKAEHELRFKARDPHETLYDTVQYLRSKLPGAHIPTKGSADLHLKL
jgi:dihydroflavonol-4-reductase